MACRFWVITVTSSYTNIMRIQSYLKMMIVEILVRKWYCSFYVKVMLLKILHNVKKFWKWLQEVWNKSGGLGRLRGYLLSALFMRQKGRARWQVLANVLSSETPRGLCTCASCCTQVQKTTKPKRHTSESTHDRTRNEPSHTGLRTWLKKNNLYVNRFSKDKNVYIWTNKQKVGHRAMYIDKLFGWFLCLMA